MVVQLTDTTAFCRDRLREIRLLRGMTQGELAQATGLYETQISRLEVSSHDPSVYTLVRLCRALDCSADYLLGLSDIVCEGKLVEVA
jgi:transcriptional regulator with XRE-family HTH domain